MLVDIPKSLDQAIDTLMYEKRGLEYVILLIGEESYTVGGVFDSFEEASTALVEKLKLEYWSWSENADRLHIQDRVLTLITDELIEINKQIVTKVEVHVKERGVLNFYNF